MTEIKLRYFSIEEFDQKNVAGSAALNMKIEFLMKVDELRHRCGFPLVVCSGYRSPSYNNQVSASGFDGAHTTGRAADFRVNSNEAIIVIKHAIDIGFTGIGINQKGVHEKRFIHLDDLPPSGKFFRPTIWSY